VYALVSLQPSCTLNVVVAALVVVVRGTVVATVVVGSRSVVGTAAVEDIAVVVRCAVNVVFELEQCAAPQPTGQSRLTMSMVQSRMPNIVNDAHAAVSTHEVASSGVLPSRMVVVVTRSSVVATLVVVTFWSGVETTLMVVTRSSVVTELVVVVSPSVVVISVGVVGDDVVVETSPVVPGKDDVVPSVVPLVPVTGVSEFSPRGVQRPSRPLSVSRLKIHWQ